MKEGRTIAGESKLKKPELHKPVKINRKAKIEKILPEEPKPATCTCCGKEYKRQRDNFSTSRSPLFAGNSGFIPVCRTCLDKYFYMLVDVYSGNESHAIERICSIFDWYFNEEALAGARKSSGDRSMINSYQSKMNLTQMLNKGTTYLDYIKQQFSAPIESPLDLEEYRKTSDKVSDRDIKRWGLNFKPEEYVFMKDHYNMLKDLAGPDDIVTDNLIRDLCTTKVLSNRALAEGDADKYTKLTKLYQDTLSTANLKPKSAKEVVATDADKPLGVWLKDIEQFSPAEFYKDKEKYSDHDGFRSYFKRFFVRPFKNLIMGTKEMDAEFSVGGDQAGVDIDALE